jgi:hypothetical protein
VRLIVLAILRRAEPVARDYVAGETGLLLPAPAGFLASQPADAMLLAARFRMLAAAVDVLLSLPSLFGGWNATPRRTFRPVAPFPGLLRLTPGGRDAKPHDTS